MNAGVGIGLYIILSLLALFLIVCGLMTAIIIPNHMGLTGWDWIFVFVGIWGMTWTGATAPIIISNR